MPPDAIRLARLGLLIGAGVITAAWVRRGELPATLNTFIGKVFHGDLQSPPRGLSAFRPSSVEGYFSLVEMK